jgi:hypothetical protein
MKLDELLKEYRDAMPATPKFDFDAIERREAARRQRQRWVGVLAAAAAIAVVMFYARPNSNVPVVPAPEALAAPIVRPVEEIAAPIVRPVARHTTTAKRRKPAQVNEFIAIGEASMLPAPQSLQVMRVSLTGARLAALGLLPAGRDLDDRVTADVLMGEDGMARAIRLVSAESFE